MNSEYNFQCTRYTQFVCISADPNVLGTTLKNLKEFGVIFIIET